MSDETEIADVPPAEHTPAAAEDPKPRRVRNRIPRAEPLAAGGVEVAADIPPPAAVDVPPTKGQYRCRIPLDPLAPVKTVEAWTEGDAMLAYFREAGIVSSDNPVECVRVTA